jgi:hypothetical protein
VRNEQRSIADSQRSLKTHLTTTSHRLDQLSPIMKSGFDNASRKQDQISDSLVFLHDTHRSLTTRQTQIAYELDASAGREQAILKAVLNARDMIVDLYATSTEQARSQVDSCRYIRRTTDAHSDSLEQLSQVLEAIQTQHQEKNGAPDAFLCMKLRLPLTRSVMELVIRPTHDELHHGVVSSVPVSSRTPQYTKYPH